jgi:hypothetical protein
VSFEDETSDAHERRIVRCGSCQAKIIWLLTKNLKPMPVDADAVLPADTKYDHKRHVSHFATCPNAAHHRRK